MTYVCEFHGGYVSPIGCIRDCGLFKTGLAKDERGYKRAVFFTDAGHHPDPWVAAVRPETPRAGA